MAKKKTNTPNAKAAITPSPLKEPHEEVRERLLPDPVPDVEEEHVVIFEATPAMLRQKSKARKLWCAIIALSMGIIVFIGILAILRAVQDASVYPTTKPVVPKQYEASISINMPYINLVEPVYVHVDEEKGLQKLSYYGGMLLEVHQKQSYIDVPVYWICSDTDVYIFNTSGISYQVIPVIKDLKCFQTDPQPLQHVFPDLSLFEAQRGVYLIRGKSSYVWKYKTKGKGPTAEGLLGEYSFYVDSKTNQPIRFHYVGRNAMLGGSHIDEYYLDYLYIREGPIDPHTFSALPSIMNCTKLSDYHGPTRMPLQDLHMLMPEGQEKKVELFADFKDFHEKSYKDVTQETQRMVNFHHNVRYINSMNRQGLSYHLKVNHMADLSEEERRSRVRGRLNRKENNGANFSYVLSSPRKGEEIDWRKAGAVTPVKDQGSCGSCWTFGTTGVLEGQIYKKYKKLYDLSSQVLMDCSWDHGNMACDGGFDYQAYEWIIEAGGIEATSTYGTYRNAPGYCHFNRSNAVAEMTGFVNVTGIDALNDALVTIGPLSVSIDATLPSFYFYGGGYYDDVQCKSDVDSLDHSVLAVGITQHNGVTYTIVKNSWSTHWGEDGYVKISQKDNLCGVATAATYPLIK